jgi:hypothetical protein
MMNGSECENMCDDCTDDFTLTSSAATGIKFYNQNYNYFCIIVLRLGPTVGESFAYYLNSEDNLLQKDCHPKQCILKLIPSRAYLIEVKCH